MTKGLDEWCYSNPKRYHNYLAVVTQDTDGNCSFDWLEQSRESDEYFNVAVVKIGDVLLAGCKDRYKNRTVGKYWYGVVAKNEDTLTMVYDTTFNKVKKTMKEVLSE